MHFLQIRKKRINTFFTWGGWPAGRRGRLAQPAGWPAGRWPDQLAWRAVHAFPAGLLALASGQPTHKATWPGRHACWPAGQPAGPLARPATCRRSACGAAIWPPTQTRPGRRYQSIEPPAPQTQIGLSENHPKRAQKFIVPRCIFNVSVSPSPKCS